MIDKKKACPVGGTTEQATETAAFGEAAISCSHCTTAPAQRQVPKVRIADFLNVGEKNGLTMKRLQEILPGDSRSLRTQIEQERRTIPILSGPTGYYLPDNTDEVRRFLNSMRHRGRRVMASAANVERAAGLERRGPQQLDGQEVLF